jgi:hypothetical protein
VRARKPELSIREIERQLAAWRASAGERSVFLDAARPPDDVLAQALDAIDARMAARHRSRFGPTLALRCLGRPDAKGRRYAVLGRRGRARWILPAGIGSPGPGGGDLYRPACASHVLALAALEALQRSGLGAAARTVRLDPEAGLAPVLARALDVLDVELAAALSGTHVRADRVILAARHRGRTVAFAKVAAGEGLALRHELRVLEALRAQALETLVAPEPVACLDWQGNTVLVLRPLPLRGRVDRAVGAPETRALAELAELRDALGPLLGRREGLVPLHGDFAPWNAARLPGGKLALWDWEGARLGLPLEDLFYWRAQRVFYFGRGTIAELVGNALDGDPYVRELISKLALGADAAPRALRAALERSLDEAVRERDPQALLLHRHALARLAEAS